jgi:predicted dehydrogenase
VHQFHFLRYVFGEVSWVSAVARTYEPVRYHRDDAGNVVEEVEVDVDDTYMAVAGFEGDAVAQLLWSWAGHGDELTIPGAPAFFGSKGCIQGGELILDEGTRAPLVDYFHAHASAEEQERFFPLGLTDPYAIQQLDWLRAIELGQDPEVSGREGLHDLACAFAMLESSVARRQVMLEEVLSGSVRTYQLEIDRHYGLA